MASHQSHRRVLGAASSIWTRCLVCFSFLSLGLCAQFDITWTPENVSNYTSSNPLQVKLGDVFRFRCPGSGPYSHSSVWIQDREEQYKECDCLAGNSGGSCEASLYKNTYCSPPVSTGTLTLIYNDGELGSFLSFNPGQQYYLISYTSEQTLDGALSEVSQGGHCLQGLKMSFMIADVPTEPVTTETRNYTSAVETTTEFPTDVLPTDFSGGSGSGLMSEETADTTTESEFENLPARTIQDWHVVMIVVLSVIILVLVIMFVLALVIGVMVHRRRDKLEINPEGELKNGFSNEVAKVRDEEVKVKDSSEYPTTVFHDPLDQ